jgi:hypothetical protein
VRLTCRGEGITPTSWGVTGGNRTPATPIRLVGVSVGSAVADAAFAVSARPMTPAVVAGFIPAWWCPAGGSIPTALPPLGGSAEDGWRPAPDRGGSHELLWGWSDGIRPVAPVYDGRRRGAPRPDLDLDVDSARLGGHNQRDRHKGDRQNHSNGAHVRTSSTSLGRKSGPCSQCTA